MKRAIGVFDSGVGGLSVLRELKTFLPNENYIYIADNLYCPYGLKTKDELIERTSKITDFLVNNNVKIIVVACNTATSAAINSLRLNYKIPFIGMEPATKPAAENTKTLKIGILATKGTLQGQLFKETKEKYASNVEIFMQIGDGLVEAVENGDLMSAETINLLKKHTEQMIENNIDHLVLGCTHYPFLIPALKSILPPQIKIIDPAPAVAKHTQNTLRNLNLLNINNEGEIRYYATGEIFKMQNFIEDVFFGRIKINKIIL